MCVLEYIFQKRKQAVKIIKDNEYILDFLKICSKESENSLDDSIVNMIEIFLAEKS